MCRIEIQILSMTSPQYPSDFIDNHVTNTKKRAGDVKTHSFDDENIVLSFDNVFDSGQISETLWKCPVCFGLPRVPVSLGRCGHIGCEQCLRRLLISSNQHMYGVGTCPICRELFDARRMMEYNTWPMLARTLWKMLRVKCSYAGCSFIGDPISTYMHEKGTCKRRLYACPATGCTYAGFFDDTVSHTKLCRKLYVYCIECGYVIRFTGRQLHDCDRCRKLCETLKSKDVPFTIYGKGDISMFDMFADEVLDEAVIGGIVPTGTHTPSTGSSYEVRSNESPLSRHMEVNEDQDEDQDEDYREEEPPAHVAQLLYREVDQDEAYQEEEEPPALVTQLLSREFESELLAREASTNHVEETMPDRNLRRQRNRSEDSTAEEPARRRPRE